MVLQRNVTQHLHCNYLSVVSKSAVRVQSAQSIQRKEQFKSRGCNLKENIQIYKENTSCRSTGLGGLSISLENLTLSNKQV